MRCIHCGAMLENNATHCKYCGSPISVEMQKEKETLNKAGCPVCHSTNVTFQRETQKEIKNANGVAVMRATVGVCKDCGYTWKTDVDETISLPPVVEQQYQYQYQEQPTVPRHLGWWILGFIFFFPIPLTVLIWRKKSKLPMGAKVMLTIILWGFIIGAGSSNDDSSSSSTNVNRDIPIYTEDDIYNTAESYSYDDWSFDASLYENEATTDFDIIDTSFRYYTDQYGSRVYYGIAKVENTGDKPIYLRNAKFDLEDNDGHLLQTAEYLNICPCVLAPGETGYVFNGPGLNYLDESISTENGVYFVPQIFALVAKGAPTRFEIDDTDIREDTYGTLKITGRILNTSSEDCDYTYVHVIFFDKNGDLLAATGNGVTDLRAGSKTSFEISCYSLDDNATVDNIGSYEIYAEESYWQ